MGLRTWLQGRRVEAQEAPDLVPEDMIAELVSSLGAWWDFTVYPERDFREDAYPQAMIPLIPGCFVAGRLRGFPPYAAEGFAPVVVHFRLESLCVLMGYAEGFHRNAVDAWNGVVADSIVHGPLLAMPVYPQCQGDERGGQ